MVPYAWNRQAVAAPAEGDRIAHLRREPGMSASDARAVSTEAAQGQYLTFTLGCEQYGVDILHVQEIKGTTTITPIPNSAPEVKGVMNLRGTIVPVIDLRTRFGLAVTEPTPFAVIIVVGVGTKIVGMLVDAVSDVLTIPVARVQMPPELGRAVDGQFIEGIVHSGEGLITLLDVAQLLGPADHSAARAPA